jgi:1A family penicillin-binding protein
MNYYYSQWNRNNRPSTKNRFFQGLKNIFKRFSFSSTTKKTKPKQLFKKLLKISTVLLVLFLLVAAIIFTWLSFSLPDPNRLNYRTVVQSTRIFARDGTTLLYEIHGEAKRTLVNIDELPDYVKNVTIAVEDKTFYSNPGIYWKGILRSIFVNIIHADPVGQGGSTITQQFVRNAILTREKTYVRKIKEIVLAIELEQKFSKDEILQMYLNEISYGKNAYGIEAAAQTYFGKNAKDLTLSESAYLASIIQAPSYYNPTGSNRDRLDARKNLVLQLAKDQGYISQEDMKSAQDTKVEFKKAKDTILAPHFVQYIQELLAEKYGEKTLQEEGLNIITSLDWNMQQIAEKAVQEGVARNEKANKANNAALVAVNPKNGQILAMVGSRDFFDEEHDGQVNVVLRDRQPGSSFKPYVYATAFKQGMSPATMLVDVKTMFGTYGNKEYIPENYNGKNYGILNMRKALAGSLNVPAVKTLALVGVDAAIQTAKDLGITSNISSERCGLSLVLGGCDVKLLDHVSAMGVFANGGIKQESAPILKITNAKSEVLFEYQETAGTQVIDPQVAYLVTSIMTDNDARTYIFGAKSPLILPDRVVAGKTGTTQSWRDGWTVGFTPSLAAGVWTGNNDYSEMRAGADGVVVAAPIWNQFMRESLKNTPVELFTEPSNIQHIIVDATSGKLPTEYSPSTKTEVFADFSIPKDYDNIHLPFKINKLNGWLATSQTPTDLVETKVFTVIHSEKPENPDWETPVVLWAQANDYNNQPTQYDDGSTTIKQPINITPKFITPALYEEIKNLPYTVKVDPQTSDINSVEVLLEGQTLGIRKTAPFTFLIDKAKNGFQTLQITLKTTSNQTFQNSIRININQTTKP